MATHSIILAWKIPWTEEPGGLQSMESQRVCHGSFHLAQISLLQRKLISLQFKLNSAGLPFFFFFFLVESKCYYCLSLAYNAFKSIFIVIFFAIWFNASISCNTLISMTTCDLSVLFFNLILKARVTMNTLVPLFIILI